MKIKHLLYLSLISVTTSLLFGMQEDKNFKFPFVCATEMLKDDKRIILYADAHDQGENNYVCEKTVEELFKKNEATNTIKFIVEWNVHSKAIELYSDLIKKAYGKERKTLHRLGTLLAKQNVPKWVSTETCECRDYNTLMHSYIQVHKNKQLAHIAGVELIQEFKKTLSKKTYKNIFHEDVCIQEHEGVAKKIFQHIKTKILYEIDDFKETLKKFECTEDTHLDILALNENMQKYIFTEEFHFFLSDVVDAHILNSILKSDNKSSNIVFAGTKHTSAVREWLSRLGFLVQQRIDHRESGELKGDVLRWIEKPIKLCSVCFKQNATKQCGKCKYTKYCSVDCQKIAWSKFHKDGCNSCSTYYFSKDFDQK